MLFAYDSFQQKAVSFETENGDTCTLRPVSHTGPQQGHPGPQASGSFIGNRLCHALQLLRPGLAPCRE